MARFLLLASALSFGCGSSKDADPEPMRDIVEVCVKACENSKGDDCELNESWDCDSGCPEAQMIWQERGCEEVWEALIRCQGAVDDGVCPVAECPSELDEFQTCIDQDEE